MLNKLLKYAMKIFNSIDLNFQITELCLCVLYLTIRLEYLKIKIIIIIIIIIKFGKFSNLLSNMLLYRISLLNLFTFLQ